MQNQKTSAITLPQKPGGVAAIPKNAFETLSAKINDAIQLLSEIEQIVATIRMETGKAQALRDQLKELIGGG